MKKLTTLCGLFIVMLICITGCTEQETQMKKISYNYSITNGDEIEMILNIPTHYKFSTGNPFTIKDNDNVLCEGTFITGDSYYVYKDEAKADEKVTGITSGDKDGNIYTFWITNNNEYVYDILISNSNTGVLLKCKQSKDCAEECFNSLSFSKSN